MFCPLNGGLYNMQNYSSRSKPFLISALLSAVILLSLPGRLLAIEFVGCGFPPYTFTDFNPSGSNPFDIWEVQSLVGGSQTWGNLADCGLPNLTGGSGEAACMNPPGTGPAYDTALVSPEFNLKGATSASFKFRIRYLDVAFLLDRLTIEVSGNGGATWDIVHTFHFSNGPVVFTESLAPYLGSDSVKVRFRYYDPSPGNDVGGYVQIDDFQVICSGGADLSSSVTTSTSQVIEGQNIDVNSVMTNLGPMQATTAMMALGYPASFGLLSHVVSGGAVALPFLSSDNLAYQFAGFAASQTATIDATVRALTEPEVSLTVDAPAGIAGDYDAKGALFGPRLKPGEKVSGTVKLVEDGVSDPNDGCSDITNTAEISGNIALMLAAASCDEDEQVKNAEKAGAKAAIIVAESLPPGYPSLPPDSFAALIGFTPYGVMKPSGSVTSAITIPSIRVTATTGNLLQLNVVNGLNVSIAGKRVLSQEFSFFSFSFSQDEFDPGFPSFGLQFLAVRPSEVNNLDHKLVTVLGDSDFDGSPDISDQCPDDPSAATLKDKVVAVSKLVKKVKPVKTTGKKKKDKKKKKALKQNKKLLKEALDQMVGCVDTVAFNIAVTSASVDLGKLTSRARKAGRKATKTGSPKYKQNRKKALRALKKVKKALL
ncbi:MAG: hypothetical protein D6719_00655 [Candidatus Dadabacteria bacterium]|nr:MAG: hypothetical protein D6719_00655 [Candidatus Dadabacteria bacterium]